MDKDQNKIAEQDSSSTAALDRGKKAIDADEKINKKDLDLSRVKDEGEKDAEQWRNEG